MFEINQCLVAICPAYRRLASEFRRLEGEYGALVAAYGNALNDQNRAKGELTRFEDTFRSMAELISHSISDLHIATRDDPGRNGSGR